MWLGTPATLEFAVGPDEQAVRREVEGAPMAATRPLEIGASMRVTLQPHWNFEILSPNGETKPLGPDESAAWQWQIRPKEKGGPFVLFAKVEVLNEPGAKPEILDDYSKRVPVNVQVGAGQGFVSAVREADTFGKLLSALFKTWETTLIALAALLAALAGVVTAVRNLGPKGHQRRADNRQRRATKKAARAARRPRRT